MSWEAPPVRLMTAAERRQYVLSYWRMLVPVLVTLALTILMTAPVPIGLQAFPQLGMLSVFVWATFRPTLMPPWAAFPVGIIADLLFGQPVGVNATLYALTAAVVRLFSDRWGHFGYAADWAVAVLVAMAWQLGTWQLMALAGLPVPLLPMGVQVLTTAVAYPAVVWLCARIQMRVFGPTR